MVRNNVVGRVTVEAKIENAGDLWEVQQGKRQAEDVRRVMVTDALVDTGAAYLALPTSMIRQLGFTAPIRTRTTRNTTGEYEANIYGPVRLTINGRDCSTDVAEVADGCPVLIGQLPLETFDLVVDMANHRLIGNPAHGGEWVMDMF
jgi:predicted aspartyl protease